MQPNVKGSHCYHPDYFPIKAHPEVVYYFNLPTIDANIFQFIYRIKHHTVHPFTVIGNIDGRP